MKAGYWRLALGLALTSTFAVSCAQDVGDIDRTQADKLEKALFDDGDEWYFRQTVVDTDFQGTLGIFVAAESSLKRVRWVITEDVLYAMSTVEPAEGVTLGFFPEDERAQGVVAAFPIRGHFDVQRAYNAQTGEQSNVIVENASDLEWYQRKYFRVDWGTNLADGSGMFGSAYGSISSASFDVPQDDNKVDPNRTRISHDYIDTVTTNYYDPDIYACFYTFGFDAIYSCEGGLASIRNSFLRMPEQKTYAPLDYLDQEYLYNDDGSRIMSVNLYDRDIGQRIDLECDPDALDYQQDEYGSTPIDRCSPATFSMFSRFGYFRTERLKWDEEFGSNVEANRLYYANRWNIWQTMFEYDEDGNVTNSLDMDKREAKPIVYYLNVEYPDDFYDSAQEVARQWDLAFKQSVMLAKNLDSIDDVTADLEARFGDGRMYRIERNSCSGEKLAEWNAENGDVNGLFAGLGGDIATEFKKMPHSKKKEFCAQLEFDTKGKFSYQRLGDLRYSFFNWVEQNVPWLGYGPSAADPITGQIISGNANFNGTAIRTYGPLAADYVQYMNGELDDETLAYGEHIRRYLEKQRQARAGQRSSGLSPEGKRELSARMGRPVAEVSPTNFDDRITVQQLPEVILREGKDAVQREALRISEHVRLTETTDTKMSEFYDQPAVRDYLMKDKDFRLMIESAAANNIGPGYDEDDIRQAYLDVTVPELSQDRYEERNQILASRNIFSLEHMTTMMENLVTYTGVADHFKGASREEIGNFFIHRMFVGTQLHEVGHTMGLRHNFIASTDVLNYHDTYWEIQQAIADGLIAETDRWSVPMDKVKDVVGTDLTVGDKDTPGLYLNEAEFRIASVMDYTADFTGRFAGLGKYDQAAINFAYAEKVEVWSEQTLSQLQPYYDSQLWISHYREIPRIMAGSTSNGTGTVEEIRQGIFNITKGREYITVAAAKEKWRNSLKSNTENWKQYRQALNNGGANAEDYDITIDTTVPYEFCSDEFNGSQLNCSTFDWGANQREIVNQQFSNYRLFQTFRRYNRYRLNKLNQGINNYAGWVARIFAAGSVPFRYYSIYQWYDIGEFTDDLRDAAIDTINFYAEAIATPEAARFCLFDDQTTSVNTGWFFDLNNTYMPANWDRANGRCNGYLDVGRGEGQPFNYQFNNEYRFRVTRTGTFIDKSMAIQAMFNISSNYAFSEFFTDFRATNISYWTLFRDELYDYIRGVVLGDYQGFAGVVNSSGEYEPPMIVDPEAFGTGAPNRQAGMARVYTPMSFTHEFNMLVGAMINNSTWADRYPDFAQFAKVYVGWEEAQDVPPGTEVREFIHPLTNQIYRAPVTADGRSITADLVDQANLLKADYEAELVKLGNETEGTQGYQTQRQILEGRSQQLEDTVAKLDMIRFVWAALGSNILR